MKTEKIMGIPVDNLTYNKVIQDIPEYLNTDKKMTAISINPQIVLESNKYPEIIQFIESASHRIPDGIGIVLVSKLTGGSISERLTGFELMKEMLVFANLHYNKVFFYGATAVVLNDMIEKIGGKYPNIQIVGGIDGYTSLTEEEIVRQINQSGAEFLFVALGFPKQEIWLSRNVHRLNVSVFQDVGGSFDVMSGHVKRAPKFFLKYNLEWLYRSLSVPSRIGRIFQLPVFVVKSLYWRIKNAKKNSK
jgi:N-acetylglucosaminyldiphosphoundecaprenol N-acetyl-beta-D-mannosaminyltransferase